LIRATSILFTLRGMRPTFHSVFSGSWRIRLVPFLELPVQVWNGHKYSVNLRIGTNSGSSFLNGSLNAVSLNGSENSDKLGRWQERGRERQIDRSKVDEKRGRGAAVHLENPFARFFLRVRRAEGQPACVRRTALSGGHLPSASLGSRVAARLLEAP
jgi:hypothetical protein